MRSNRPIDHPLTRDQLKEFKRMHIRELEKALTAMARDMGNIGFCYGAEDATMAMLMALRDEFGFGNERTDRLIQRFACNLEAIHEGEITAKQIHEQMEKEGLECLKYVQLMKRW